MGRIVRITQVRIFGSARGSELKKISQEEAEEQYKLSQKQRYLERNVRKWKRRAEVFKDAEDTEYYKKSRKKIREWQLRTKKFTEDNNLRRSFSRENVEKVTKPNKSDIILTNNEQYALNKYMSSDFYTINEKLRNGIKLDNAEIELTKNLDSALDKMPNYHGLVSRSLQFNEEQLKDFLNKYQQDSIVECKAYTATTSGERYSDLSNVELYINSKAGKDIRRYNTNEQEILFKRSSLFKVKQIEKLENTYHILLEDLNEKE